MMMWETSPDVDIMKKGGRDMKVRIDEENCTGCGLCEDACAEGFEVKEDGIARVKNQDAECIKEAAEECLSDAIIIEE